MKVFKIILNFKSKFLFLKAKNLISNFFLMWSDVLAAPSKDLFFPYSSKYFKLKKNCLDLFQTLALFLSLKIKCLTKRSLNLHVSFKLKRFV